MPSSVLLALLIGAGVLALVPALIRRYDSSVRRAHEDRTSVSRVLTRRRARFVPMYETSHGSLFQDTPDEQPAEQPEPQQQEARPEKQLRATSPAVRRRWILLTLLGLAVSCGALAILFRAPLLWLGTVAAVCGSVLVLRQARAMARIRSHTRVAQRAERAARERRAHVFLATLSTHTDIDDQTADEIVDWLMTAPQEREEPSESMAEVFAAANREALCVNRGWVVRRIERPRLVHSQDDVGVEWGYVPEPFAPELERDEHGTYYRRAAGE